jgi:hypothetical protein
MVSEIGRVTTQQTMMDGEKGTTKYAKGAKRCSHAAVWNEIPPAPFFKGGETPGSFYSSFSKGGWGDLGSDLIGSRLWCATPSCR